MGAYQEIERASGQIRALTANPAIEQALDKIEVLCQAYMEPSIETAALTVGLNKTRAEIFNLLHSKLNQIVSRRALMNAMYPLDNTPDSGENVLRVQMCHVRKAAKRSGYSIENIWGQGYRMTKAAA